MKTLLTLATLTLALLSPAHAGDGHDHDHDHDAPAAAPGGPALPRFAAVSDTFELVGVVKGRQLSLYLDRFADNSPVPDATLDMEVGGRKVSVAARAPGEYQATLAEELKPGITPVTVTVEAGGESDILAGDIDIHEEEHADPEPAGWPRYAAWAGVALLAAGLVPVAGRRTRTRRPPGDAA